MEYQFLKFFKSKIESNQYSSVLDRWQDYIQGKTSHEELYGILKAIKESSEMKEVFKNQAGSALKLWDSLDKEHPLSHKILSLVVDLHGRIGEDLKSFIKSYIENRYKETSYLGEKLRLVGLSPKGADATGALRKFDLLNHLQKENLVLHKGKWGVGEVVDVHFLGNEVICEFEGMSQKQVLTLDGCLTSLEVLDDSAFIARRFLDPAAVWKEASSDPVKLIRKMLEELGPLTASDIKEELTKETALYDPIIFPEDWTKWWQTTRTKLKKDTKIIVPSAQSAPFKIRSTEISHEEILAAELDKVNNTQKLIQMIRDFSLSHLKGASKEFKATLKEKLHDLIEFEEVSEVEKIQVYFLLEELGDTTKAELIEIIKPHRDIIQLISSIDIQSYKKKVLNIIKECRGDYSDVFMQLFFDLKQNHLREFLLTEVIEAGKSDAFAEKMKQHLKTPYKFPEMLIWYFQKMIKNAKLPLSDKEGKTFLLECLFNTLGRIESDPNQRDLTRKIHTLLFEKTYSVLQDIFAGTNVDQAKEIILLSTQCSSLTDHQKKIVKSLAEVKHPNLADQEETITFSSSDILWITKEGSQKLKARIEEIGRVELPQIAQEIKEAKSHGDLKENHEYKTAKERQAMTQGELKRLSDQDLIQRFITPEDITLEHVGIGSVIDYLGDDGAEGSYTILGHWEANTDKKIISFQSKLAQDLEGKKPGEKFSLQGKEFTIKNIRSFFDN